MFRGSPKSLATEVVVAVTPVVGTPSAANRYERINAIETPRRLATGGPVSGDQPPEQHTDDRLAWSPAATGNQPRRRQRSGLSEPY